MTWYYKNEPMTTLPESCDAFVYIITNKTNGKRYVGKKLARFKQTKPPLKGKKKKRITYVDSDWKDYWGSNDHLKNDVVELGPDSFTREILYLCPTRGIASYLEAREQFERRVLEDDTYYNGIINVRIGQSNVLKEYLTKEKQQSQRLI